MTVSYPCSLKYFLSIKNSFWVLTSFQSTIAMFGESEIVELVILLGYYTLVAMTLNVFAVEVPDGEEAPW